MTIISVKVVPRVIGAVAAVAALLLAAGCGQPGAAGDGSTRPGVGGLSIVTAFYPFQFIAERVAGQHAGVTSLTAPGAEPHDLELTPRQVASVTTADLVIYEKSFQAAVDEAVVQSGNPNVLDTATVVPLVPLTQDADEHDQATAAGEDEPSGLDPHVWLDPSNMIAITDAVADRLSAIDRAHANDYRANAKALVSDLTTLDKSYRTGLAGCERREFVTTHAAFGYLARAYDLQQIGINGLSPDSEPSPARIAAVQQIAREHQITTIFYETLVSPDVATSIAGDLGLKTDVLDPVEGITDSSRGSDYVSVMESNLAALRTANGCR